MSKVEWYDKKTRLGFECPGCGWDHVVNISEGNPTWTFNGDYDRPTFSPSILVRWTARTPEGNAKRICHSFVTDGKIQFLDDCTHALAGMTVELKETELE